MKEKIAEQLKATGKVRIVKTNEFGIVTQDFEVPNVITTAGKNYIAAKMHGTNSGIGATMTHMAIGAGGAVAADAAQTALSLTSSGVSALTGVTRNTFTSQTLNNNAITYSATFAGTEGTGAVTEAGIFNDASAGTMLCRTVFSAVNKGSGDTISITWVVTVS
jgi:hypothetical protein